MYHHFQSGGAKEDAGLFGWSLVHHGDSLYVGAPLAGPAGQVFRCEGLTSASIRPCVSLPSPAGLRPTSWFGGSLAASTSTLYSCAFKYSWQDYAFNGQKVGKCFSLTRRNTWETTFDFTDKNFVKSYDSPWFSRGYYGISSTVDDVGDLGNSSLKRF